MLQDRKLKLRTQEQIKGNQANRPARSSSLSKLNDADALNRKLNAWDDDDRGQSRGRKSKCKLNRGIGNGREMEKLSLRKDSKGNTNEIEKSNEIDRPKPRFKQGQGGAWKSKEMRTSRFEV